MCGLVGALTRPDYSGRGFSKALLTGIRKGESRGKHSTGLFQMDGGKHFIYKKAVTGTLFADIPVVKHFVADADVANFTLVHHRWATTGEINDTNAHPFIIRETASPDSRPVLAGAHNGVISNFAELEDGRTFEVDSEWALYRVMRDGDEAFKHFRGSFVLIYHDFRDNSVNFVSDGGRSLYLGRTPGGIIFASEEAMLKDFMEAGKLDGTTEPLPRGERISFDAETLAETSTKIDLIPPYTHYSSYSPLNKYDDEWDYREMMKEEGFYTNRKYDRTWTDPLADEENLASEMGLRYQQVELLTFSYDKERRSIVGECLVKYPKDATWKDCTFLYRCRMSEGEYESLIRGRVLKDVRWQASIRGLSPGDSAGEDLAIVGRPYPAATQLLPVTGLLN